MLVLNIPLTKWFEVPPNDYVVRGNMLELMSADIIHGLETRQLGDFTYSLNSLLSAFEGTTRDRLDKMLKDYLQAVYTDLESEVWDLKLIWDMICFLVLTFEID